jgi:signal transduction histidine kinase/ActR/RegA family two-component response regulator
VLVALGVGSRLQRLISGPILALAHTAQAIAEKQDFSVRAQTQGRGEVGLLTHAFNQMLSGIEERDTALIQANQTLRTEVTEREQAERAAQAQLQRLDLLNQITRAIGGRHDLDSIYQVVLRHLEEALSLDFGLVSVYDATRRSLKVTHVSGRSRALARDLMRSDEAGLSVEESGLDGCVLGGVVYEPELEAVQGALSRKMVGAGLRSFVAAPLVVESQVFGVLIAARNKANDFHPGECEFLRQLSEHVALAAHQAELHGALQRAYNDLRQTQQTVMQQERLRALGQMASGIAHDINNAISPVALYTGALLEYEPGLSAQARSYLETIQRAVDDVAQTVLRMGEFYRTRESEAPLAPVDLNLMVEQVIDLTRARWSDMAQHRGVTVQTRTEFTPNLPAVMGTESEIREALTNLVFNAVDAMPQGGTLVLRTGRAAASPADGPARVVVEVIDAGTGMDEETRRRCLEPFFTTKGERGTGLGLAMVYGIARRQGADIEIDTELGRGTTIRLVFPVPQGVPGLEAANDSPTISGPMRILLVDDDPILLHSLRDVLETDGHRVSVADGGQAGIDSFIRAREDERPFAVVITDLGMPNVDGSKVASAIKGVSPETPVILLTGWGQRLMAEGTVPPHVDCVLSKPPRLQAVRASLARYVSVPEGLSRPRP